MPLILAIEPDKRQSSQLVSLVKGLHAELVHGANATDGLAALHGRVPDLVLTSSLISPRDDAALAAHLRELGAAAAHVQSVTIPLLGSAAPARARGGMLAVLRREKPQAMTDGCAPDVFAEQVRQYLATAEDQKIAAASRNTVEAPAQEQPLEAVEQTFEAIEQTFEADQPFEAAAPVEPEPAEPEPMEPEPVEAAAIEVAPIEEAAAPIEEAVPAEIETFEPAEISDEPAGLPLSQLLQLVTETAILEAPIEAALEAPAVEEPAFQVAPAIEVESVPVLDPEPVVEAAGDFGELYVDPVAAQALEELSRETAPPPLGDGIPAEVPVPVVEMHSFQSLDSIANELAAGPAQRHESLDDIASLFAATPASNDESPFASLFARQAPPEPAVPVHVPGIDPSLFASAPATPTFETESFEPAPVLEIEAAPLLAHEPIVAAAPVLEPVPEPEPAPEPIFVQPVQVIVPEPEPEPVVVAAAPEPVVVVAAPEPEPVYDEPLIEFEPVVFAPVDEEPALAAAPELDEEIALDVDSFAAAEQTPAITAPAEPARFSFTLVEGFGDAWSDFEVPSMAVVAADLGVSEHAPSDPYVLTTPARAAANAQNRSGTDPAAAPALDQEALSLIGDAARKVSLDALVIEEFERGLPARRAKKVKKKAHAGATQVPSAPAPERQPAPPGKRPVQDEWGMFDPEQCGFAALEDEEGSENRPATTGTRVRVISY